MSSIDYYAIGQRIRKYRKLKGLSQEALAELSDISTAHMSHIETASTKLSLPVLLSISKALKVPPEVLISDSTITSSQSIPEDIIAILESCPTYQARIICDIIRAAKQSMEVNL